MGAADEPAPALLIIAVLCADSDAYRRARDRLAGWLGPLRQAGPEGDFGWTDYYAAEMGSSLRRSFLIAERLVAPGQLAALKLATNGIEAELSRPDGTRRVNLDPGLLSLENFVLASTKRQPQRIYLRDGIYAEVTLHFAGGRFVPQSRTYPEYRSPELLDLLADVRQEYKDCLRAGTGRPDPATARVYMTEVQE